MLKDDHVAVLLKDSVSSASRTTAHSQSFAIQPMNSRTCSSSRSGFSVCPRYAPAMGTPGGCSWDSGFSECPHPPFLLGKFLILPSELRYLIFCDTFPDPPRQTEGVLWQSLLGRTTLYFSCLVLRPPLGLMCMLTNDRDRAILMVALCVRPGNIGQMNK